MDYGCYAVVETTKPVARKLDRMVLFAVRQLSHVVGKSAACSAPEFTYGVARTFLAIRSESLLSGATAYRKVSWSKGNNKLKFSLFRS